MISCFNSVGNLLATSLVKLETTQERSNMLKKWIQICDACLKIHNFNTTMGIYSGLTSAPVGRLKLSWAGVPTKWMDKFHEIEKVLNPTQNFRELRELTTNTPPPKIPYIGISLADLTFVEDGNPDLIKEDRLINFAKRQLLGKVIMDFLNNQNVAYSFQEVQYVQLFLVSAQVLDPKEAYRISRQIESGQSQTTYVPSNVGSSDSTSGSPSYNNSSSSSVYNSSSSSGGGGNSNNSVSGSGSSSADSHSNDHHQDNGAEVRRGSAGNISAGSGIPLPNNSPKSRFNIKATLRLSKSTK